MAESFVPSFPDSPIWPYVVQVKGGQAIRLPAASATEARKKVLARYKKGTKIESVTTLVVTAEQIHRILDA